MKLIRDGKHHEKTQEGSRRPPKEWDLQRKQGGAGRPHPRAGQRPILPDARHLLESSSYASLEAKQSIPPSILSRFDPTVHTKWRRR